MVAIFDSIITYLECITRDQVTGWNRFDAGTKTIRSSSSRPRNVNACAMGKFGAETRRIHGREFKETTVSHFRVMRGPR